MIGNALLRLGVASVVVSILLALTFLISNTPYTDPYTTVTWGLQIGGFLITTLGAMAKGLE